MVTAICGGTTEKINHKNIESDILRVSLSLSRPLTQKQQKKLIARVKP